MPEKQMTLGKQLAAGAALGLMLVAGLSTCSGEVESPDGAVAFAGRPEAIHGDQYSVLVAEGATPDALESASREFCRDKQWCQVLGWRDEQLRARAMPMMPRESEALAFSYLQNRGSGYEQVLFDCAAWPDAPADRCIPVD